MNDTTLYISYGVVFVILIVIGVVLWMDGKGGDV